MNQRLWIPALTVWLAFTACSNDKPFEVRVAGSSTVFKRTVEPILSLLEREAGIQVVPDIHGTGAGFVALMERRADVLLSSAELPTVLEAARAIGWEGRDEEAAGLYVLRIHDERIVVIVNSANPVDSLSHEELVGIMAGRITNWKEVGGKDLPIMVVLPESGRATREVFEREVMKGVPFASAAFDRQETRKSDDIVRANASAIGVTAEAFFYRAQHKIVETTKVTRPLLAITRDLPKGAVERFIDYVNGTGRKFWLSEIPDGFWMHLD